MNYSDAVDRIDEIHGEGYEYWFEWEEKISEIWLRYDEPHCRVVNDRDEADKFLKELWSNPRNNNIKVKSHSTIHSESKLIELTTITSTYAGSSAESVTVIPSIPEEFDINKIDPAFVMFDKNKIFQSKVAVHTSTREEAELLYRFLKVNVKSTVLPNPPGIDTFAEQLAYTADNLNFGLGYFGHDSIENYVKNGYKILIFEEALRK